MVNIGFITKYTKEIAKAAGTDALVDDFLNTIKNNQNEYSKEAKVLMKRYKESERRLGKDKEARLSTGKQEKVVFAKLSDLCNKGSKKELNKMAVKIMIELGYPSYKKNPNRFKQMTENRKKKLKKGAVNKNPDNQSVNQSINEKPVNQSADKLAEVIPEFEDHEDNSKNAEENSTMEEETEDNQEEEEYKENQLTQVDTSDQNSNILDVNNSNSDNNNITGGYDNERDMILGEYFPNSVTSPQDYNQMIALPLFVPNDWDLYSIPTYSNNPQDFDNLSEYSNDNPLDDIDNLHFQFPFLR